ncbi:D-2-hydroxyacid dehydrogenase [archaeon]|nr:MAG: D-2-hydroxyacid dehydrogenase [archaeon]
MSEIINEMPFLVWVHSITAGVDHLLCPELVNNDEITLTNARGVFAGSLAEYVMLACSYFAKDIPRMKRQQASSVWDKFMVTDLRGKTMGIVGYGNIGLHCARLAKAYGMKVLALRRNPEQSVHDKLVDTLYGPSQLDVLMKESDFLVICMALTSETKGYVDAQHLSMAKKGQVLINIGRGALVDEAALVQVLRDGPLAGAALDVFCTEPLPADSPLWQLPNVLVSPHNADLTSDSRQSSVRYFTQLCQKFISGEGVDEAVVDKSAGY